MNKILSIILLFVLMVSQGCEDEWGFDAPGCMDMDAENYDVNATFDNGSCSYLPDVFTIDASSYDEWVYFSLSLGAIVEIEDSENSLSWDIAFKRNHIKTNSGESGFGNVCAIVDETESWTSSTFQSISQISDNDCEVDTMIDGNILTYQGCYSPLTHLFSDCIKNPALDKWGAFDDSYTFNVNNYHFFIKDLNDSYYKFWGMSYYDANGESGHITFAYDLFFSN